MPFTLNQSMDDSYPPSKADERGYKRLPWRSLVQRVAGFKTFNHRRTADQCSISDIGSVANLSMRSESSLFYDPQEEALCELVVENIAKKLTDPSSNVLRCSKFTVPDLLLRSLGQELLHLAATEPCGLRGALIDLCVEQPDQQSWCSVDQFAVDPDLVPTFHLTLVLRPESGGIWRKVQKLFKGVYVPSKQSVTVRHTPSLRLSTGFTAIRRKLYSSEELLIEEC